MSGKQYIFIHPWLNRDEHWGGLMVSTAAGCDPDCLARLASQAQPEGTPTIGHQLPWFVPLLDPAQSIGGWPLERTVFLLSEPEEAVDQSWLAPVEPIRQAGGKVGLISYPHHALPPPGGKWDYVFVETQHARTTVPVKLMVLATQTTIALGPVRTRQDFDWGLANQCALLSADFIHTRSKEPSKPDMMRAHLLQLLSLITQDADTAAIEDIFRQEPKLSYSLLRLVNSAALGLRTQISSFSQAINLLGRRQLQRWLQLLVYADPGSSGRPNPLLQWAAMRGRLIELAFAHINPPPQLAISADSAFMTGIFSLLDVLLNLSMDEILAQLPVVSPVKLALTERAGPLGDLLCAIENAERHKPETASQILESLGITCDDYVQAQLDALEWSSKVSQQAC